jgi:hypothetical protein
MQEDLGSLEPMFAIQADVFVVHHADKHWVILSTTAF